MAYYNTFPMTYQPYGMNQGYGQMPQNYNQQASQNNSGIVWVQGEAGAKSYLVAPNTTVALWDSESQTVYLKMADASGMPSIKTLDYTVRQDTPQKPLSSPQNDFATKSDVESIQEEIVALNERINSLTKKGAKKDE